MKKASKFLLVILIGLISLQSYSQTFGIKGGFNLANALDKDDDGKESDDFKMDPGFHLGGTIGFDFSDLFSVESGLFITTKGFRIKEESGGEIWKMNVNLYYLEIPFVLKASVEVATNVRLFGAVGPNFGMGVSGKIKYYYEDQGESETDEEKLKWGNNEDSDLKRFDFGLTFAGGVEVKAIQIGISYDLGLANISVYTDNDHVFKNRVLKFSVGYRFGKNNVSK